MGHRKGNEAELEVAKLIQPWWRRLDPGAIFVRTPRSGGWTQGRDVFDARGDLMSKTTARFPWCVEVKRREAWSFDVFLAGDASPVWKWWFGACFDAQQARLHPMLWVRQNRRPWVVLLRRDQRSRMPNPEFCWSGWSDPRAPQPAGYFADRLLAMDPRIWSS